MGFKKTRPPKPTIDELAYRFIHGRYPIARMRNQFGRKKTNQAIDSIANVILMIEPDHPRAKIWDSKTGRDRL